MPPIKATRYLIWYRYACALRRGDVLGFIKILGIFPALRGKPALNSTNYQVHCMDLFPIRWDDCPVYGTVYSTRTPKYAKKINIFSVRKVLITVFHTAW